MTCIPGIARLHGPALCCWQVTAAPATGYGHGLVMDVHDPESVFRLNHNIAP